MRTLCLPVLLLGMSSILFAQGDPIAPCCGVVSVDTKNNLVTVRDKTTGRLYQFQADKLDIQSIKKEDEVNITGGKVTSVKGAQRSYPNTKISYIGPCCGVVAIESNGIAPCCSLVSFGKPGSSQLYSMLVPKHVASTIKIGDPVFAEPANAEPANAEPANTSLTGSTMSASTAANSGQAINGMGIIYADAGDGQQAYAYPIQGGNSDANSSDKWHLKPNNLKGVTGRLVFSNMPKDAEWQIDVYREPDNKFLQSFYTTGAAREYTLAPGSYTIRLMLMPLENVPVKRAHDTELKFGYLKIVSNGDWTLSKEQKNLFWRSAPGKFVLPPGTYTLKLGGTDYPVVIKDGETVEY